MDLWTRSPYFVFTMVEKVAYLQPKIYGHFNVGYTCKITIFNIKFTVT